MTTDWQDQVAAAVRSVDLITVGGTCWFRAAVGRTALTHLGLRPRVMMGGAIFRAGPDEMMDSASFCGRSNHAELMPNGRMLFHVWLEVDGDIIDFSTGDWRKQSSSVGDYMADDYAGPPQRPIQWDAEPPEYIWQPAHTLIGERFKTPPLGKIWYARGVYITEGRGNEAQIQAYFDECATEVAKLAKMVWPAVKDALPSPLSKPPGRAEARRLRQMQQRKAA